MASKASLRAYCALGCCHWFGEEIRNKHEKGNKEFIKHTYTLQAEANKAATLWEDKVTRKQVLRIQTEFKKVFSDGDEDALRVASMLLAALEDIREHVKPEKQLVLSCVLSVLNHLTQEYYDLEGTEWNIYESALEALDRFNAMIERI